MKKTSLLTLGSLAVLIVLAGCGQNVPYVGADTQEECLAISKNLLQVEAFRQKVEKTSAFHLEESSIAMLTPQMTVSNNKPKMLRDVAKRKASLEAEQAKLGCLASEK